MIKFGAGELNYLSRDRDCVGVGRRSSLSLVLTFCGLDSGV